MREVAVQDGIDPHSQPRHVSRLAFSRAPLEQAPLHQLASPMGHLHLQPLHRSLVDRFSRPKVAPLGELPPSDPMIQITRTDSLVQKARRTSQLKVSRSWLTLWHYSVLAYCRLVRCVGAYSAKSKQQGSIQRFPSARGTNKKLRDIPKHLSLRKNLHL